MDYQRVISVIEQNKARQWLESVGGCDSGSERASQIRHLIKDLTNGRRQLSAYLELLDREGFPHFSTTGSWGWIILLCGGGEGGTDLCIAGCLASLLDASSGE